jgi:hypothetical protein
VKIARFSWFTAKLVQLSFENQSVLGKPEAGTVAKWFTD